MKTIKGRFSKLREKGRKGENHFTYMSMRNIARLVALAAFSPSFNASWNSFDRGSSFLARKTCVFNQV